MTPGTLVKHTVWGLGKVIEAPLPYLVIHFSSLAGHPDGPRRKLQAHAPQISVSDVQSDPELDAVSLTPPKAPGKPRAPRPKAAPKPLQNSIEQAIEWFKAQFPGGFSDEGLVKRELQSRRTAQKEWGFYFGDGKAQALLDANDTHAITDGLTKLYQGTDIPAPFEKMAVREGLKDADAAKRLLSAVLAFVNAPDSSTFTGLSDAISSLPSTSDSARVLTWPNLTLLPFLADPSRFMVLKPTHSQKMARRMGFDLLYSTPPTWAGFESCQKMSLQLKQQLAPLGASDFIDVQAFVTVTRDLE